MTQSVNPIDNFWHHQFLHLQQEHCNLVKAQIELLNKWSVALQSIEEQRVEIQTLRKNIGLVQQDVYLFAGTVLENIRYGKPDATEEEIIMAAKQANAHDFIMCWYGWVRDVVQVCIRL